MQCLFPLLCQARIKHFCCTHRMILVMFTSRKGLGKHLSCELNQLFSTGHLCTQKKDWWTNCLLRPGRLASMFWKMNKVSPSLQENQLTVFVANDNTGTFEWKLKIGKTCIHYANLTASRYVRTFLIGWVVIITNVMYFFFCYYIMKCIDT